MEFFFPLSLSRSSLWLKILFSYLCVRVYISSSLCVRVCFVFLFLPDLLLCFISFFIFFMYVCFCVRVMVSFFLFCSTFDIEKNKKKKTHWILDVISYEALVQMKSFVYNAQKGQDLEQDVRVSNTCVV